MIALGFGPWEIAAVLAVALLLFGNRVPSMARSLGSGIVEFKRGLRSGDKDKDKDKDKDRDKEIAVKQDPASASAATPREATESEHQQANT